MAFSTLHYSEDGATIACSSPVDDPIARTAEPNDVNCTACILEMTGEYPSADDYASGYAHGKEKAHFELRTWDGSHVGDCGCEPCQTVPGGHQRTVKATRAKLDDGEPCLEDLTMGTQPEPDYHIAVVLATERGRTAVVALISDLTGPVDTVILERPPKHNYPQRQRRRLVLQVIGSALERIERPSTVGLMCEEEEVVKMLRSVKITGQGPEGDDREFWQLLVAGFRYHNVTQMLQKKRKRMDGLGRLAREAGIAWLEAPLLGNRRNQRRRLTEPSLVLSSVLE